MFKIPTNNEIKEIFSDHKIPTVEEIDKLFAYSDCIDILYQIFFIKSDLLNTEQLIILLNITRRVQKKSEDILKIILDTIEYCNIFSFSMAIKDYVHGLKNINNDYVRITIDYLNTIFRYFNDDSIKFLDQSYYEYIISITSHGINNNNNNNLNKLQCLSNELFLEISEKYHNIQNVSNHNQYNKLLQVTNDEIIKFAQQCIKYCNQYRVEKYLSNYKLSIIQIINAMKNKETHILNNLEKLYKKRVVQFELDKKKIQEQYDLDKTKLTNEITKLQQSSSNALTISEYKIKLEKLEQEFNKHHDEIEQKIKDETKKIEQEFKELVPIINEDALSFRNKSFGYFCLSIFFAIDFFLLLFFVLYMLYFNNTEEHIENQYEQENIPSELSTISNITPELIFIVIICIIIIAAIIILFIYKLTITSYKEN